MDLWFLYNAVFDSNFLMGLLFLTLVIWVIMRALFNVDSLGNSLILAILAFLFLPALLSSTYDGSGFLLVLILCGAALSWLYNWTLSAGVLIAIITVISAAMILPNF